MRGQEKNQRNAKKDADDLQAPPESARQAVQRQAQRTDSEVDVSLHALDKKDPDAPPKVTGGAELLEGSAEEKGGKKEGETDTLAVPGDAAKDAEKSGDEGSSKSKKKRNRPSPRAKRRRKSSRPTPRRLMRSPRWSRKTPRPTKTRRNRTS